MKRNKNRGVLRVAGVTGLLLLLSLAVLAIFSTSAQEDVSYVYDADFEEYAIGDRVLGKEGNGEFVKINQAAPSLAIFDRAPDDPENTVIRFDMAPGEGLDAEIGYDYLCTGVGSVKPITWDDGNKKYGTCDLGQVCSLDGGRTCFLNRDSSRMYRIFSKKGSYEMQMGGVHIDRNLGIANPQQVGGTVVLETSVYIPKGAAGYVQAQTVGAKGWKADGTFGSLGFRSLYTLELDYATLSNSYAKDNQNYKSYTIQKETWNTISVVFDLDTGVLRYYVNNIFAFEDDTIYTAFAGEGRSMTLSANCWVIAKVPRDGSGNMEKLRGCCYLDRVRMHALVDGEIVDLSEIYGEQELLGVSYTTVMGERIFAAPSDEILAVPGEIYLEAAELTEASAEVIAPTAAPELYLRGTGGIRFVTQVNTEKLNAMLALEKEGWVKDVQIGTLIVPKDYLSTAPALTHEALTAKGLPLLDVEAVAGQWNGDTSATPDEGFDALFSGSILNLKKDNRAREFIGVGYVRFRLLDGTERYLYSYALGSDNEETYADSIKQLCVNALADADWIAALPSSAVKLLESYGEGARAIETEGGEIQNVCMTGGEFFFQTANGVSCRLTFGAGDGWRLQAIKPQNASKPYSEFSNGGAGQALAIYLGESCDETLRTLTVRSEGGALYLSAEGDEGYVLISYRDAFAMKFYSADGTERALVDRILSDGKTVTLGGTLSEKEGVYGGGHRFDTVNKRGSLMNLYIYHAYDTDGGVGTSVVLPLFTTTRGAGLYINRYEEINIGFDKTTSGADAPNRWEMTLKNDLLDCYFWATGNMSDPLAGYSAIAGAAALPEEWAQGLLVCRYAPDFYTLETGTLTYASLYDIPNYVTLYADQYAKQPAATKVGEWSDGAYLFNGSGTRQYRYDGKNGVFVRISPKGCPGGYGVKEVVSRMIEAGMTPTGVILEPTSIADITDGSLEALEHRKNLIKILEWLHGGNEYGLDIRAMGYICIGGMSFCMDGYKPEYYVHASVDTYDLSGNLIGHTYTKDIPKSAYTDNPDAISSDTQSYLDITNPEAVEWYMEHVWGELLELGLDGAKIDFCEAMPDEGQVKVYDKYGKVTGTQVIRYDWYDSRIFESDTVHQGYPSYFTSLFFKEMNRLKEEKGIDDGFIVFTRGSGIGAQRNPYYWTGDQMREFSKIRMQLVAVINSGISGMPFMSYDMAGYAYGYWGGYYTVDMPELNCILTDREHVRAYESELFIKAIEYSAFTTNIQTHGDVRNSYELTKQAQRISALYTRLHQELLPYIQKLSLTATETGLPPVRAMVLEYPEDENVYDIKNQFLLGDGLLVAPMLEWSGVDYRESDYSNEKGIEVWDSRKVYLPAGNWLDLLTNKVYNISEGMTITPSVTIDHIPVYLNLDSPDAEILKEIFEGETWSAIKEGTDFPFEEENGPGDKEEDPFDSDIFATE
ncbi:MAG: hypothetical protein IJX13_00165 [Clostridia bacterium]|nr:hypothetical protein [Clostridia bacterium]